MMYKFDPPENVSPDESANKKDNKPKTNILTAFKKTIELDELSFDTTSKEDNESNQKKEDYSSLYYPLIKIGDYIVSAFEIDSMTIDSTEFLPTITLQCTFTHADFFAKETPKDGDIISIAIRNKSDVLKILRNDYVITGLVAADNVTEGEPQRTMTFFGMLFIPGLSSTKQNFSYEGTSMEAMKELAKIGGLGFATNEDNTNDKQIWMNGMSTSFDYINNTISRAWKDATSFYDIWIDIYYNLNFINVDKQLMSTEDEFDLGVFTSTIDKEVEYGSKTSQQNAVDTVKVFNNFEAYKNSPFYINSWKPDNKATDITFKVGTKINCNVFEHNTNVYKNDGTKYWKVPIEPTYDPDKVKSYILLRGRATQDPDKKGNETTKANYTYTDIYEKNPWMGTQYTISDTDKPSIEWDGNQHKNYARAKVQNLINLKELDKLNVSIVVSGTNLNIIKGEKISIAIINTDSFENSIVNEESAGNDILDKFYSGWYYVKGFTISYNHENDQELSSNFSQRFILTRREWPTPVQTEPIKNNNP